MHEKMTTLVNEMQADITKKHISKNNVKKIRKEMRHLRGYTVYLYDDVKDMDKAFYASRLEDKAYVSSSSFVLRLYEPIEYVYKVQFYDGSYTLYISSYQGSMFMQRYILLICIVSVFIFLFFILFFVHRKMRYVLQIGDEMKQIEEGNYHHTIVYKGNDEITVLAKQLHHLRNVLYERQVREREARKANEELVTAMSHDLRTPLTSLMGYLDILDLKLYKNEEERNMYLQKTRKKAEQIKVMSDKLFNHFLAYAQQDEVVCATVSGDEVRQLLMIFSDELRDRHFKTFTMLGHQSFQIRADHKLLERVFDNLFSNICKYASGDMVIISLDLHQGQVIIKVKNKKKKEITKEESTQIGLKSVYKMMKDMGANAVINKDVEYFCVELIFPYREIVADES